MLNGAGQAVRGHVSSEDSSPVLEMKTLRAEYEQYSRFQQDLEFLNMLANPYYLECKLRR